MILIPDGGRKLCSRISMRFDDAFTYYLRVNLVCCVILKKIIVSMWNRGNVYEQKRRKADTCRADSERAF